MVGRGLVVGVGVVRGGALGLGFGAGAGVGSWSVAVASRRSCGVVVVVRSRIG